MSSTHWPPATPLNGIDGSRGHNGHVDNERVDVLACAGLEQSRRAGKSMTSGCDICSRSAQDASTSSHLVRFDIQHATCSSRRDPRFSIFFALHAGKHAAIVGPNGAGSPRCWLLSGDASPGSGCRRSIYSARSAGASGTFGSSWGLNVPTCSGTT